MNDRNLMKLHVAALFTCDANGDMLLINEPRGHGGLAPRLFIGQTDAGRILRFRNDVDRLTRVELQRAVTGITALPASLDRALPTDALCAVLERSAPISSIECGPAFVCPAMVVPERAPTRIVSHNAALLAAQLPEWVGDVEHYQPMLALVRDNEAVALCCSVRITPHADEAGVETVPSERGHGFAPAVVTAWAATVQASGRTALYSTSWDNTASLAVARKLGLTQFGNDVSIT